MLESIAGFLGNVADARTRRGGVRKTSEKNAYVSLEADRPTDCVTKCS